MKNHLKTERTKEMPYLGGGPIRAGNRALGCDIWTPTLGFNWSYAGPKLKDRIPKRRRLLVYSTFPGIFDFTHRSMWASVTGNGIRFLRYCYVCLPPVPPNPSSLSLLTRFRALASMENSGAKSSSFSAFAHSSIR